MSTRKTFYTRRFIGAATFGLTAGFVGANLSHEVLSFTKPNIANQIDSCADPSSTDVKTFSWVSCGKFMAEYNREVIGYDDQGKPMFDQDSTEQMQQDAITMRGSEDEKGLDATDYTLGVVTGSLGFCCVAGVLLILDSQSENDIASQARYHERIV